MARPQIDIDPIEIEKLARLHCSNKEIAEWFGCSTDTIERRFAAELRKGREQGRQRLRQLQWQAAEKGNIVMLIFLGKQYLGQADKIDQTLANKDGDSFKTASLDLSQLSTTELQTLLSVAARTNDAQDDPDNTPPADTPATE